MPSGDMMAVMQTVLMYTAVLATLSLSWVLPGWWR